MATSMAPSAPAVAIAPARPTIVPISADLDDGLLEEIDLAMQVRTSAELRALDDFTPFGDR
jgi:hypothetical protein